MTYRFIKNRYNIYLFSNFLTSNKKEGRTHSFHRPHFYTLSADVYAVFQLAIQNVKDQEMASHAAGRKCLVTSGQMGGGPPWQFK
jgi:hypothetical protein